MLTFILLISTFVLVVATYIQRYGKPANFPPGPAWLPVVGSAPYLKKLCREKGYMHSAVQYMTELYQSPVIGLKLGNERTIVVTTHEVVQQVHTREEYEGRPYNFFIKLRSMGARRGITFTEGEVWHEQRSFAVRHLKQVGYGKQLMEDMILKEVLDLLDTLGRQGSGGRREVTVGRYVTPCVLNVLWVLVTGGRFSSWDDPRLQHLMQLMSQRAKAFDMSGGTLNQFPWLRFFAPEWSGYNLILRINAQLKDIIMGSINEHFKRYDPNVTNDLVDAYLHEMEARKHLRTSNFTHDQLMQICMDFFIAGAIPIGATLDFLVLMMLLHPDVQRKAQKEIDAVVGCDRLPQLADRNKLPYVEAVLMEVQRMYVVTPVTGPRRVTKDTMLHGYNIPKDTTVLISLWSVHRDQKHWGDPDVFRPERFIDKNGELIKDDWLLNFGVGKRRCLGEALGRGCVFLFSAGILQRYEILRVPGKELPSALPIPGITMSPPSYDVLLRPRFLGQPMKS
ncbi:methyl farnesoate epoxidase-like isoform X2 [Periplaneta americana]|uniref:methyl farnesoate epoxidase-like isoform X2 n=1 Tax=Periplaneta americana TaxID=6978 RepID=UPI0037E8C196